MSDYLKISLNNKTTRQKIWRVVFNSIFILIIIFLGYYITKTAVYYKNTNKIMLRESLFSITIRNTPHFRKIIKNNVGNYQVFEYAPWTMNDFLDRDNKKITFIFNKKGINGVVFSNTVPSKIKNTSEYNIIQGENDSLFWLIKESDEINTNNLKQQIIKISYNNYLQSYESNKVKKLKIDHFGVSIKNKDTIYIKKPVETFLSEEETPIANFLYTKEINQDNLINNNLFNYLKSILSKEGSNILIYKDEDGLGYKITTNYTDLTTSNFIQLITEMNNRTSMSTQEWTIEDGTTYKELIGNTENSDIKIKSDENITYVSSMNKNATFKIIKTPINTIFANRSRTNLKRTKKIASSCNKKSNQFVKIYDLIKYQTPNIYFLNNHIITYKNIYEINFSNSINMICWKPVDNLRIDQ